MRGFNVVASWRRRSIAWTGVFGAGVRKSTFSAVALAAAFSAGLGHSGMAVAQEAEKATPGSDEIIVTGSRLTRVAPEGPLPVTVIDREAIDVSGDVNLADFLRTMTFNSAGSFESASGFGGGQQGSALLDLRGVGAERTLILVDGRRLAYTPAFGAAAQDLNIIPLAAIERVEILREGASAVYGSDAIGGVVNIITKKDYQGVDVSWQVERPSDDGGDGRHASFLAGLNGERGNVYVSVDHFSRDPVFMRDRDYLFNVEPSPLGFPGSFARTTDGTLGGTVESPNIPGAIFEPFASCPDDFGSEENPLAGRISFPLLADEDTLCGYRFAGIAGKTAAVERNTISFQGDFDLGNDIHGFTRISSTQGESFGRFAPAPVTPVFSGVTMGAENPNNPTQDEADGPFDLIILYRLAANGPRDSIVNTQVNTYLMGLRGELDFAQGSEWEVGFFENRFGQAEIGTGYGLRPPLQGLIDEGVFDPFNPSEEGLSQFDHTITTDNIFQVRGVDGHVRMDSVIPNLQVPIALVVGGEYRDEEFRSIVDAQSAAGNVFGSAGSSAAGSRTYYALFAETGVNLFDDMLELGFALRLDDYSDFGNETSPKISAALRPIEDLLIRASFSEGFRAPDLEVLNRAPSQSFPSSIDNLGCMIDPDNTFACEARQRETFFAGNPDLEAETSENINFGVVWNVTEKLSLSVDYYNIKLDNGISNLTAQDVLDNELRCFNEGRECDPAQEGEVIRTGPAEEGGQVSIVRAPAANFAKIETDGIDFETRYQMNTAYGRFGFDAALSWAFSFKDQTSPTGDLRENVDTTQASSQGDAFPEYRVFLGANWVMANLSGNLSLNHIPKIRDCSPQQVVDGADECSQEIDAYTTVDLQFGWQAPWATQVSLGVKNLLDEEPPLSRIIGTPDFPETTLALYDVFGRIPYLRIRHSF